MASERRGKESDRTAGAAQHVPGPLHCCAPTMLTAVHACLPPALWPGTVSCLRDNAEAWMC